MTLPQPAFKDGTPIRGTGRGNKFLPNTTDWLVERFQRSSRPLAARMAGSLEARRTPGDPSLLSMARLALLTDGEADRDDERQVGVGNIS